MLIAERNQVNYDNITVSVWMKTSSYGALVSNRYNSGGYGTWYTLFSNIIEIGDNTYGGYRYLTFNTPTTDGLWHHIAYTKNGINHAIYVDGFLDQSFTSNANISKNQPFYIGKGSWTMSDDDFFEDGFAGIIDEVQIYNRALSADEIALFCTPPPPSQPSNPSPSNTATGIRITTDLSWTAGSYTTSHDVYFGTVNPPPFVVNQTATTYDTGTMDNNTTYYWRIDEKNASGTTAGNVWSFTTELDPNLPVAWWKFDEGTGTTTYDSTGHNYIGTITAAIWLIDVNRGWCLTFDSSGDYVTVPDTAALDMSSAITIAAWLKPTNFGNYYFIVTKQPSGTAGSSYPGNYEFRTEASTGRLNFLHQTSSGTTYSTYTSSSGLTAGIWQSVVVTLGSGQVNFYINVLSAGTTAQSGTFGILNNEPVRIGKRKDSSSYFNGSIDDVRIYDRALSAAEVALLYAE